MPKVSKVREPHAAYGDKSSSHDAGPAGELRQVNATEAKNRFGSVLADVENGAAVAISRHNTTTAVILPAAEYERLRNAASQRLNLLADEFDALLERMQAPGAKAAMQKAIDTPPRLTGPTRQRRRHG